MRTQLDGAVRALLHVDGWHDLYRVRAEAVRIDHRTYPMARVSLPMSLRPGQGHALATLMPHTPQVPMCPDPQVLDDEHRFANAVREHLLDRCTTPAFRAAMRTHWRTSQRLWCVHPNQPWSCVDTVMALSTEDWWAMMHARRTIGAATCVHAADLRSMTAAQRHTLTVFLDDGMSYVDAAAAARLLA